MIKHFISRWLADYSMVFGLLVLCLYFSIVTYQEQSSTGEEGAIQVSHTIASSFAKGSSALIVVRNQSEEIRFSERLTKLLGEANVKIVSVVRGEPKDARTAIDEILQKGGKLDVIACTQATAEWGVFADLPTDFPALGNPKIVTPYRYAWPTFLKRDNLLNIADQISVIAIVAIGMTMVIISGGIDLSVGSLIGLSTVLIALFIRDWGGGTNATLVTMALGCVLAIVLCGLTGAFSGSMITYLDVPPFIVTLAMMLVGNGLAFMLAEGQSIADVPNSFVWLGRGANLFGIPNAVVLMFVLYVLAHILMSRMKLGRYLYAVGGNREAARLSGVPVQRVTLFAYVACGVLSGLGGVIIASRLTSGSAIYGDMYELYVIAAVVVGGTSLSGGEGKMFGTLIGAFIIAVIQNGMNLTDVESYTQKVILGFVILGAVLLDKLRSRY